MEQLSESLSHIIRAPYLYYAVVAVALLVGLYLVYTYRRANQAIIPFKTQGGNIEVAPSTLRGVMQHAANSVEGVEKATCRHFIKGRSLGVRVAIHLRANNRLKEVEGRIKNCIQSTLREQFGMENIEPIHIRVTRIIGDPVATTNPSYPDDLDESQAALLVPGEEDDDERPYADETRLS
jgi:uncharacterized alkaline shock family protein YloU